MNNLIEARDLLADNFCIADMEIDGKYCSAGALLHVNGLPTAGQYITNDEGQRVPYDPYTAADKLPESKALATEILNSEWFYDQSESMQKSIRRYYDRERYGCVVWNWNDEHSESQLQEILDMFTNAAAKYDA